MILKRVFVAGVISRTLSLGGNGAVKINYTDGGTAPLRVVKLVE